MLSLLQGIFKKTNKAEIKKNKSGKQSGKQSGNQKPKSVQIFIQFSMEIMKKRLMPLQEMNLKDYWKFHFNF